MTCDFDDLSLGLPAADSASSTSQIELIAGSNYKYAKLMDLDAKLSVTFRRLPFFRLRKVSS